MELRRGRDARRAPRRAEPLPLAEALRHRPPDRRARSSAAHEQGHRPPRPQARERHGHAATARVKVLDFGLAKRSRRRACAGGLAADGADAPRAPTPGMVLGTRRYMSARAGARRGHRHAHRHLRASAACSTRCVTGRRPFAGETLSDTVRGDPRAREPDWSALPAGHAGGAPRNCSHRCLEKDVRTTPARRRATRASRSRTRWRRWSRGRGPPAAGS